MPDSRYETLAIADLQVGMYVHLDMGWMRHPFACNHFKIVSHGQLEAIRQLGISQIRIDRHQGIAPAKRGVAFEPPATTSAFSQIPPGAASDAPAQRARPRLDSLFTEAARQCKAIFDATLQHPETAGAQAAQLVQQLTDDVLAQPEHVVHLLSATTGERSSTHALHVTYLSLLLARACGVPQELMVDVGLGALLHDIGKLQLPSRIRVADESMTAAESNAYRQHVDLGMTLGRQMGLPASTLLILAQHREFCDGSGYPLRLTSERIALPARIVALANAFDGLCNPANARRAMTPHEALSTMFARMRSKFDATALGHFIQLLGIYPPGSVVELNDARHALVVGVNPRQRTRPHIIVADTALPPEYALVTDLEQRPDLGIRRALKPQQLPRAALDYLSPPDRICYYFDPSHRAAAASPQAVGHTF